MKTPYFKWITFAIFCVVVVSFLFIYITASNKLKKNYEKSIVHQNLLLVMRELSDIKESVHTNEILIRNAEHSNFQTPSLIQNAEQIQKTNKKKINNIDSLLYSIPLLLNTTPLDSLIDQIGKLSVTLIQLKKSKASASTMFDKWLELEIVLNEKITVIENYIRGLLYENHDSESSLYNNTVREVRNIGIFSLAILLILLVYLFFNIRSLQDNIGRNKYLATVTSNSNEAIFGADPSFKINLWNKTAEEWYGPTELEMLGTNIFDLISRFTVDAGGLKEYLLEENKTKNKISFQTTDYKKDGTIFYTLNTITKLFNADGQLENYVCTSKDITDIVKLQHQLEQANEQLMTELLLRKKELLEYNERITDGIISLDKNFEITYANQYAKNLLGGDDVIGKKPWYKSKDEGLIERLESLVKRVFDQKRNITFDYYLNGFDKWMQFNAYPSENGISFFFKDTTKQKEAELALKQSEEKYRSLIENSPDIIAITDENGYIWDCNGAVEKATGYTTAQIIGKHLYDFMLPEDVQYYPLQYHEVPDSGFLFSQRRGMRKDGSVVHFEIRVSRMSDKKLLAILTDISDREQLQKNLTENNARLDFLYLNTPSYIVSLDVDGTILDLNKNIDIFQRESIIGKNLLSILPEYLQEDTKQTIEEVKQTRENVYRQFSFISSTGQKFWFSTILKPIIKDDRITGIITNTSDITSIKEQEKELSRTKQRLEKILESVPAFIAELDEFGNIITINKSRTGKTPESLIGHPLAECVEFADYGKINIAVKQCLEKQDTIELELTVNLSDSELPIIYLCNFLPLATNGKNSHQTVLLTAFDISESRRKEAEVRRLDDIIKASPAWAAIADVSGKLVFMNNAMRNALEIPLDEDISNMTIGDAHDSVEYEKIKKYIASITNNTTIQFETVHTSRSGKQIPTMAVVMKHYDNTSGEIHYSMKALDLTEINKKTEEVKRLADIIDNTEAIVGIGDLEGGIIFLNKSGRRILGFGENEDLTKMNIRDLHSDVMKERLEAIALQEAMKHGSWTGESVIVDKSGVEIPIKQVIVLHKDKHGKPTYLSTTAIDIREEKEAAAKLATANEDLRNLATHLQEIREEERVEIAKEIHDELGQKLAVLKMESAFTEKKLVKEHQIQKHAFQSINTLIDDTIQISRELYNNLRPTMLNELGLVATITWMKNTLLKRSGINIELDLAIPDDRQFPENITIGLFRIIQESTNNISKHAQAKNIYIALHETDNTIRLSIQDDGIGFVPDTIDTKMHHGVLGMRERSLAMGGSFLLDTAPGKGTHIEVVVPLS
ncbi:MAG: PAS domain S-box protein [Chitinophagaceae bacterium]|nr:PAS domain S-box protein [Chitinophagaceae bacterium]